LNSMKRNVATLVAQILGTAMHIFFSWIFVDKLKYEIPGIGIACMLTNVIILIFLHFYTMSLPEIREANNKLMEK